MRAPNFEDRVCVCVHVCVCIRVVGCISRAEIEEVSTELSAQQEKMGRIEAEKQQTVSTLLIYST